MKIDPIIKAALKHNRAFEKLANGDIIVRASTDEPELELGVASEPWNPTPEQIEVASWFNRKETTPWSKKESLVWTTIQKLQDFTGDDWQALRWYYTESGCKFLRKDLGTLLNNWQGEIDRAKNYEPEKR
jgi:hypothetical protein